MATQAQQLQIGDEEVVLGAQVGEAAGDVEEEELQVAGVKL